MSKNKASKKNSTAAATTTTAAEERLRKNEKKIRSIFNAIPHAVIGLKERRIIFVNDAVKNVFGWKPKELMGKNTRVLYRTKEEYEEIAKHFYPVLKKQQIYNEEFPCRRKDNKEIICMVSASRIGERLEDRRIVVMYEDITERAKREEKIKSLKELDRLKDDFLNITAHELKTPLTSILGMSEIIKKQKSSLEPTQQKYVDIIYDESMRLKRIVNQILTATRFKSGREVIYHKSFDLVDFVLSLLPNLNLLAKRKESTVVTNIKKRNIAITSDKEKISQVIYNLVDNAIKYGAKGQTVTISATKPKRNQVKIKVTDQGPGIPPSSQKELFTKFSQLEPSLSRSREGTGLGLYICKLIVNRLGGEIGVRNARGQGSTFYFTLPVKKTLK